MMRRYRTHALVNRFAGSGIGVGEEVLPGRLAGRFRVAPDVEPAGDVKARPLGYPDDAVVHDELQWLGDLVVAEVAAGRIVEDLLPGAQLGYQVFRLLLGGDMEVEVILPRPPVADDRPVLAELRHHAAVTLEMIWHQRGKPGAVVREPAAQLGVVGLVVLRYLLPQLLEVLEAQLLEAHRATA